MWLKNGCHLLSHSFLIPWVQMKKEIHCEMADAAKSNKFSNFRKNHFTSQSQFSFLKKKRERERLKLKLFTSVRDSDPQDQDSNPAKPHGFPTEITNLVSGPNKVQVLDVSSQKEFSERQSDR